MEQAKQTEIAHDFLSSSEYFPISNGTDQVAQRVFRLSISSHSTPSNKITTTDDNDKTQKPLEEEDRVSAILKKRINSHLALWKSYEDGIKPSVLCNFQPSNDTEPCAGNCKSQEKSKSKILEKPPMRSKSESNIPKKQSIRRIIGRSNPSSAADLTKKSGKSEEVTDIPSDEEIFADSDSEKNTASSWDEADGGIEHYDAWQVMNDEYAKDAGFVYTGEMTSDNLSADTGAEGFFRILGTSADDTSSQPHVMSPPLMESLLNFVPDQLAEENLWLKFSMVRDGASLETLKELSKNSEYTFLAVETLDGDVFGSFTSSGWTKHLGFFGNGEAFLWKMRYNRLTPCFSLIEQAKLESDVDIYPFSGRNKYVQLCTDKLLAVGGGNLDGSLKSYVDAKGLMKITHEHDFGFGIAINEDLSRGSTSPCGTFTNPSLVGHSSEGQVFDVLNLEIWAFTPCASVKEAEHLEIAKAMRAESFNETGSLIIRHGSTWSKESKKQGISSGLRDASERSELGIESIIIPGG